MTPWTVVHQASLSMGSSRQEYWSGWSIASPGNLPNPGIESGFLLCRQILYQLNYQGSPRTFSTNTKCSNALTLSMQELLQSLRLRCRPSGCSYMDIQPAACPSPATPAGIWELAVLLQQALQTSAFRRRETTSTMCLSSLTLSKLATYPRPALMCTTASWLLKLWLLTQLSVSHSTLSIIPGTTDRFNKGLLWQVVDRVKSAALKIFFY